MFVIKYGIFVGDTAQIHDGAYLVGKEKELWLSGITKR